MTALLQAQVVAVYQLQILFYDTKKRFARLRLPPLARLLPPVAAPLLAVLVTLHLRKILVPQ